MELVVVLMLLVVAWLVLLSLAVGLGLWGLTRHNRVSTSQPTAAPLSWVWSPAKPARLHRRLRTAVGWVEKPVGDRVTQHDHLRRQLVDQAVALDLELARVARAPRSHRRAALRELSPGVTEVERLAVRVHGFTRPAGVPLSGMAPTPPTVQDHLDDLRHHLDLLDAAHAELDDVERHAGYGPAPDLPEAPAWSPAPEVGATGSPSARPTVVEARSSEQPPRPQAQPG